MDALLLTVLLDVLFILTLEFVCCLQYAALPLIVSLRLRLVEEGHALALEVVDPLEILVRSSEALVCMLVALLWCIVELLIS